MGKIILIKLLLIAVIGLYAQPVQLQFLNYPDKSKLSSLNITSIAQDSLGFIWLGTSDGLNRFDGTNMHIYRKNGLENLPQNQIQNLYVDSNKTLWVSCSNYVCIYNFEKDLFEIIDSVYNSENELPLTINNFKENNETLYLGNYNNIYKLEKNSKKIELVLSEDDVEISCFEFIGDKLLLGYNKNGGLCFYNSSNNTYLNNSFLCESFKNISIVDIEKHKGKLWIATDGQGVWSYDMDTHNLKNYQVTSDYELNIKDIYIDNQENLWVVDYTGIKNYVADGDYFHGYYHDLNDPFSLGLHVNGIFQDKHNNYWSIHFKNGLGFSLPSKQIHKFNSKTNSPFKLRFDNVTVVQEDGKGNLWLGNSFNGIDVFKWSEGRTESFLHIDGDNNGLGKGSIHEVFRDSENSMWIGSHWGGLQLYNEKQNTFFSYLHDPLNKNSISGNDIRSITEDNDRNLWLCIHGNGVDKFNIKKGEFENYSFEGNNLSNNYTFEVICDRNENVWVATAYGINVLEKGDSVFKYFVKNELDSITLSGNYINTVYEDELGTIWVGTEEGLSKYDSNCDRFITINTTLGKNIHSIIADKNNNLWLGTNDGVLYYNQQTNIILNLTTNDGLISNSFTERSVFKNYNGMLFFGTANGLNYFNPENLPLNLINPEIYVTKLRLYNKEVDIHETNYFNKNTLLVDKFVFLHYEKVLNFQFEAICFGYNDKIQYAYYLEGLEKEWNYVGNKRDATYTSLLPGKYILKIKSTNNYGLWSDNIKEVIIIIKPAFWQTVWFRLLIVLLIVGLIIVIIHQRNRAFVLERNKLEELVSMRTEEIVKQKDKLEDQKEQLQKNNEMKDRFFHIIAHDLKGPITSLMQLSGLLKLKLDIMPAEKKKNCVKLINDSSIITYNLLEDLLKWAQTQNSNSLIEYKAFNLLQIVQQSLEAIEAQASEKDITLTFHIDELHVVMVEIESVKTIFRNLVSNSIKFSNRGSEIIISSKKVKGSIEVCVRDFGIGISPAFIDKLFNINEKYSEKGTQGEVGTGLGLSLCKELVKQHTGKIWVESELMRGSSFYFTLPQSL